MHRFITAALLVVYAVPAQADLTLTQKDCVLRVSKAFEANGLTRTIEKVEYGSGEVSEVAQIGGYNAKFHDEIVTITGAAFGIPMTIEYRCHVEDNRGKIRVNEPVFSILK